MHQDFPRESYGRAQRPPPTPQNADTVAPGDVVTVTRIDRLARSTFDLFAIVKQIVDAKAQFRSLAEPWADTGTSTGRLMIAVLGDWRTWSATSSAPAPPRAATGHRSAGSTWAGPEIDVGAAGRGPPATGAGCYARRTRAQLRRGKEHDFTVTDMINISGSGKLSEERYQYNLCVYRRHT